MLITIKRKLQGEKHPNTTFIYLYTFLIKYHIHSNRWYARNVLHFLESLELDGIYYIRVCLRIIEKFKKGHFGNNIIWFVHKVRGLPQILTFSVMR